MFRAAKPQYGDPVVAWGSIVQDPEQVPRATRQARGKGGLVRATWDEVAEIVAAAHVYTVKRWGPDRIAGFSPIPAMSPVSYASGARFLELIGAPMLSFYDWYADLPNASPQMFGDQTDVPESGDWWDAGYLIMWGSNVPMTRTPDAHWMTEARYRGQKVIAVAPDYAENVKFADEWVTTAPGTDGALAMAMGHVILKEYFVDQQVPFFADYNKRYTDLPYLISLEPTADGTAWRPGKFLVAGDIDHPEGGTENADVEAGRHRRRHRRGPHPAGRDRPPLRRGGPGPLEPRAGRHRPRAVDVRRPRGRHPRGRRGRAAPLRRRRRQGRPRAARRPGRPGRRPPRDDRARPAARAVRRGASRACPARGRRRTTTRRSPRRPPGRSSTPACPPPRSPAWRASGRRTRSTPRAGA